MSYSAAQRHYRDDALVRGTFGDDADGAAAFYRRYVDFVLAHARRAPARILDIGCGEAWSTWQLRRSGHDAYGADLHVSAAEARRVDPGLPYAAADALRLPFADAAFDVVGMYQALEHIPDPERALREALRVLAPGGRLVVVGPHLLSPALALANAAREVGKLLIGRPSRRGPGTPRHPYGNTLAEVPVWHHAREALGKLLGRRPVRFLMRQPDTRPPFHSDNDACYYCNPMDLLLWARQTPGLRAVRWWPRDRRGARWLWPLGGGTWVVLEKQAGPPEGGPGRVA